VRGERGYREGFIAGENFQRFNGIKKPVKRE